MGLASLPGTILALAAAILLAVATASVPTNKSVYFLDIRSASNAAVVKLGCLGFCVRNQCSGSSVGYRLTDAASVFGISGNVPYASQLSSSLIHSLTYTLVLHPVTCGLSVLVVLFGLLQLCTGFITGWITTLFAGLATAVGLVTVALDFALFTIAKKRIQSQGGTSNYGSAIWITLAAFILLLCAQFAFCCACCGRPGAGGGGGRSRNKKYKDDAADTDPAYGNRMRMDALQAENDRLHRANGGKTEGRLPQFAEYVTEHEVPLKHDYDGANGSSNHYGVGQAYGGATSPPPQHHQYNSAGQQSNSGYVPGVGPAYGARNAGGSSSIAPSAHSEYQDASNDVGGYGAHGHGLDPAGGYDDGQYGAYQDQGQGHHDNHHYGAMAGAGLAGAAAGAGAAHWAHQHHNEQDSAVGGGNASEYHDPSMGNQQNDFYDADQGEHSPDGYGSPGGAAEMYAPSVTSGYAMGGPSTMAMPVPQRGQSSAQRLERSASQAPTTASGAEGFTQRKRGDDGFGLEALQAGAAAAAVGGASSSSGGAGAAGTSGLSEKERLRRHHEEQDAAASSSANGGGGESWQEPSAMYFDAEGDRVRSPDASSVAAGQSYRQPRQEQQQRSQQPGFYDASEDGHHGGGGGHDVPSYDVAIGAITAEQERANRRLQGGAGGGSEVASSGTRRNRPLPTPGDGMGAPAASSSSGYPTDTKR
ncbi:unnamed protein product [Jaminaea pallidilutea]